MQLGEALTSRLDCKTSLEAAATEIAGLPALLDEAREALPMLKQVATGKAGQEGVRAVIQKRMVTFPQPKRSPEEWALWWAPYFDKLAELPLAAVESGMRAWEDLATSEFMPKAGQLRELALKTPSRAIQRYQRADRAVAIADAALVERNRREKPQAERDEVAKLLAEFNAGMMKRPAADGASA